MSSPLITPVITVSKYGNISRSRAGTSTSFPQGDTVQPMTNTLSFFFFLFFVCFLFSFLFLSEKVLLFLLPSSLTITDLSGKSLGAEWAPSEPWLNKCVDEHPSSVRAHMHWMSLDLLQVLGHDKQMGTLIFFCRIKPGSSLCPGRRSGVRSSLPFLLGRNSGNHSTVY